MEYIKDKLEFITKDLGNFKMAENIMTEKYND
jgi:hypothetical protein